MSIKTNFEKLTSKEIIQLYLIVIMIYGLIFIFYKELSNFIYPINEYKPSIIEIQKDNKSPIKELSDIELLTYFNDKSRDKKIKIIETKILQNTIEIKMSGVFQNIMELLNETSIDFKIQQYEIKKVDNKMVVSMKLDRAMYADIKKSTLMGEKIFNPFIVTKVKKKYLESKIILSAIINFEILVNNNWYKKGDRIKEYLVLLIKKKEVVFLNTKTKKKIVKRISYE